MGCFDIFCCFCAGPLQDGREGWLFNVRTALTGEPRKDLSIPVPEPPSLDSVTISNEDGKYWEDYVCVCPLWSWVSPPCDESTGYGGIPINGSTEWQNELQDLYLPIHRGCLSLLCRRLAITPEQLWNSLYGPDSDYGKLGSEPIGLLYCLNYYHMEGRNGQCFGYAAERETPKPDNDQIVEIWEDYDSMKELSWLLARPTIFPVVAPLTMTIKPAASQSPPESKTAMSTVFEMAELFDLIIDHIIGSLPQSELSAEIDVADYDTIVAPSVTLATNSIFSLLQVNHAIYTALVQDRQHIFVRLAWEHGWMLPATPMDWQNWPNGSFHNGESFHSQPGKDWRGYLLTFLRKDDVHVRNRWRMHRMSNQFAKGKGRKNEGGELIWRWQVGERGIRTSLKPPEAWDWELTPPEEEKRDEDQDGDYDDDEDTQSSNGDPQNMAIPIPIPIPWR